MAQAEQTRVIKIRFDLQGDKTLKDISSNLGQMNRSLKSSESVLSSFQNKFNALMGVSFLGVGVGAITGVLDSFQKLGDRLVTITGSTEAAQQAFEGLRQVAKNTNSSIEDTLTVFARLNLSMGDLGLSTNAILGVTQTLQQTFRLSGATAAEATAATIQLSQGLASGTLRGQELRSVLEQNVVIGDLLSKEFKATRGELLKLAEAGKFTSDRVLKALANEAENLNEKASKLRPTIGEELTKAMDDLKVSFSEFNKEVKGTETAISTIKLLGENLKPIVAFLAALGAYAALPKIIAGIGIAFASIGKAVAIASAGFAAFVAAANPISLTIGALFLLFSTVVPYIILKVGVLSDVFKYFGDKLSGDLFPNIKKFMYYLAEMGKETKIESSNIKVNMDEIGKAARDLQASLSVKKSGASFVDDLFKEQTKKSPIQAMIEEIGKIKVVAKDTRTAAQKLRDLNTAFAEGTVKVESYNTQLLILTEAINKSKGPKKSFDEMNKALEGNLNRSLEYGKLTLEEYQTAIEALELSKITDGFAKGYVSADQFHKKIITINDEFRPGSAFYAGSKQYLESIGTLSQGIANAVESTFSRLEDSLVDFIETGKFKFSDFASAVIKDINRIILRAMVIRPLAEAVMSSFGGSAAASGASGLGINSNGTSVSEGGFAKGGAFSNGVQFFAKGGVVDSPTAFGMRGGMGVMGEAGSEAIMPLSRTSTGDLGIKASQAPVIVNIVNNTNSEVTQSETTGPDGSRVLEVMIASKVKDGIANGTFDRTFQQAYGLRRKGS